MIVDVQLIPLRVIEDKRGKMMRMLRADDPHFVGFGEAYFSAVNFGEVKAWHAQKLTPRYYAVPSGTAKIVLFDNRPGSKTFGRIDEFVLGESNYNLLIIPPLVWSGFAPAGGAKTALIADITKLPYDPAHTLRLDPADPMIPYRWTV